jgi:hypothetical protein
MKRILRGRPEGIGEVSVSANNSGQGLAPARSINPPADLMKSRLFIVSWNHIDHEKNRINFLSIWVKRLVAANGSIDTPL